MGRYLNARDAKDTSRQHSKPFELDASELWAELLSGPRNMIVWDKIFAVGSWQPQKKPGFAAEKQYKTLDYVLGRANDAKAQFLTQPIRGWRQSEFFHPINESFPANVQVPGSPSLVPLVLLQGLHKDLLFHFFQIDPAVGQLKAD